MKSKEYAQETDKYDLTLQQYAENYYWRLAEPGMLQLDHFTHGLSGEAGEVSDIVKKYLRDNKPIDHVHLCEEIGDVLFYCARILMLYGYSLEDAMEMNIRKLKQRYPDGFTEEAGRNRDTKLERKAMEGLNEISKSNS